MIAATKLSVFAACASVCSSCASFSEIPTATLEKAKCAADSLRTLPETRSVEIYAARHYGDTNPLISYEYDDVANRRHFAWFEISLLMVTGEPDHYVYSYPGKPNQQVALTGTSKNTLFIRCDVTELAEFARLRPDD